MSRRSFIWLTAILGAACACALYLSTLTTVPALTAWLAPLLPALTGCVGLAVTDGSWRQGVDDAVRVAQAAAAGAAAPGQPPAPREDVAPLRQALSALADELKHAKGMNKGIIEGLPVPFLLVDASERVRFLNDLTLKMLEIDGPAQSQIGRTLAEVFYNDSTRQTAVGRSIREGQIFSNLEVTISGHKGGKHHVLANVFPLYDLDRTCIGGLCLYLDMTGLKDKEAALCAQNERISAAAATATGISEELSETSSTLAAQVEQTSRTSEAQGGHMAQMSRSMDEMSAASRVIGEQAVETAAVADQAREKAQDGAEVMVRVLTGVREVSRRAETLRGHMEELGAQAQAVGGILNVISDIADQTNLLALNAAIEAARAGDAGRGFAVVADEVRKLAEKTMSATAQVEQNVTAIQASANTNRQTTGDVMTIVNETVGVVGQAETALKEIVGLSESTSRHIQSIAGASEAHIAASEGASRSTKAMADSAAETTRAMADSAHAVSGLARLAARLRELIAEMDIARTC